MQPGCRVEQSGPTSALFEALPEPFSQGRPRSALARSSACNARKCIKPGPQYTGHLQGYPVPVRGVGRFPNPFSSSPALLTLNFTYILLMGATHPSPYRAMGDSSSIARTVFSPVIRRDVRYPPKPGIRSRALPGNGGENTGLWRIVLPGNGGEPYRASGDSFTGRWGKF